MGATEPSSDRASDQARAVRACMCDCVHVCARVRAAGGRLHEAIVAQLRSESRDEMATSVEEGHEFEIAFLVRCLEDSHDCSYS